MQGKDTLQPLSEINPNTCPKTYLVPKTQTDKIPYRSEYIRESETFKVRWLIYGRRVGGRYSNLG